MINVLELIDGGFIGGGQNHIISLVNNLDKTKFNTAVSASGEGEFKNLLTGNKIEFYAIELPKIFRTKYLSKLKGIVERNKIDIIHSHGGVAGVYSRMLKKRMSGIKVIHTIHGIHYINSKNPFRNLISKAFEQYLIPFTDKFTVVSGGDFDIAKKIKIINPELTEKIPNGINLSKFHNCKPDIEFRNKFGISEGSFIAGNISRFDFQKNQRLIISAAEEILKIYPDIYFLLVGSGKYQRKCKLLADSRGINDRVLFINETKESEKYYKMFDIFLFPSLWEGLSLTVIESMASGNCILISDIPQNIELITNEYSGYTFKSNDKKDFIEKFLILYKNKQQRGQLAENALKESMKYDEKTMADKIQNIYLNL